MQKFLKTMGLIDTGMSLAERFASWAMFAFVIAGGGLSGLAALTDPHSGPFGIVFPIAVAVVTALLLAIILYIYQLIKLKVVQVDLHKLLSTPPSRVNPLKELFDNEVIPIDDLKLPTKQEHTRKSFKRCHFVGPGAIALGSANLNNTTFVDCGDFIPVKVPVSIQGIPTFTHAQFDDCIFYRVQILLIGDDGLQKARDAGFRIAGDERPD